MKSSHAYVLATRSAHKRSEIQEILAGGCTLITLDDAGVTESDAEEGIEAFETFRENAIAKARYFCECTGRPTIADDSGIMLDALGGLPGVRSRRFSGRSDLSGDELDKANNALVVDRLKETSEQQRTAHYVCAAALALPNGHVASAVGSCSGIFLLTPRGNGGFGYDPHFLLPQIGLTFAEIPSSEKHRYSHRARAFRALQPALG
jgi:XTP/dITP diphosphohydrolase